MLHLPAPVWVPTVPTVPTQKKGGQFAAISPGFMPLLGLISWIYVHTVWRYVVGLSINHFIEFGMILMGGCRA